jgi:hypothetical protein
MRDLNVAMMKDGIEERTFFKFEFIETPIQRIHNGPILNPKAMKPLFKEQMNKQQLNNYEEHKQIMRMLWDEKEKKNKIKQQMELRNLWVDVDN